VSLKIDMLKGRCEDEDIYAISEEIDVQKIKQYSGNRGYRHKSDTAPGVVFDWKLYRKSAAAEPVGNQRGGVSLSGFFPLPAVGHRNFGRDKYSKYY